MTKKVLLIEDDAVLRENTAELLELSNYEVLVAANGRLGLEKARQQKPDIIICDIMMPELDGYAVLELLSKEEHTKFIPFIFLSAKTERNDVRKGMELGADDYITKPFSEAELINAIESRLAKMAILREGLTQFETPNAETGSEIRTINDLKNFFIQNGEAFNHRQGQIIYREGQNSNYIYLLNKGVVKCHKLDEQGKELTTALHKEQELFGYTSFIQNIPYQETSTAIEAAQLVGISKDQLKFVLDHNPKITLELVQMLTEDLQGVKNQLLQMAYSSVKRKTATTLLKFAEKLNRKPEDPIIISRNDLASVAGIATETLIRTMSNFKKEGLIEIEGRNVRILDLKKLQEIY
ncbi:response regulator [Subsaximicrobium wynnwilliamsii]|uniref:Response regulator n=1 Tax=Subsaximicrobium wynnwilliamsii TaxID=291179 RepID=A0A5C6ZLY5_9FLAO|nr:response regulator [Subsaximicrobium wynnwilliamsii]TXD81578.1 response regulator [Subsaximicrobium wynnwilliamsii]TXD89940.1 response regulator [Subsaximicrobium wynnwilliamsii]TXE01039.1 response regulator [Subsaximicrobium wynnwilliamsii]